MTQEHRLQLMNASLTFWTYFLIFVINKIIQKQSRNQWGCPVCMCTFIKTQTWKLVMKNRSMVTFYLVCNGSGYGPVLLGSSKLCVYFYFNSVEHLRILWIHKNQENSSCCNCPVTRSNFLTTFFPKITRLQSMLNGVQTWLTRNVQSLNMINHCFMTEHSKKNCQSHNSSWYIQQVLLFLLCFWQLVWSNVCL